MFKSMRLGFKIASGFAVILVLALVLGGLALWNMNKVAGLSTGLAKEYAPEVAVAGNVERYAHDTMNAMRGYSLTQDIRFLDEGRKNLEELKKYIGEAKQLGAGYSDLAKLREGAASAEAKVIEYEQLVNQTVTQNEKIVNTRKTMDEAAGKFSTNALSYEEDQVKKMKKEIEASEGADKLLERQLKLDLINEIIAIGNSARICNFKFQAFSDPKFFDEAMQHFTDIDKKLEELRPIVVTEEGKRYLEGMISGTNAYKQGMIALLADWRTLQEVGAKRGETGNKIIEIAKATALGGMDQTNEIATAAASSLSAASFVMTTGLGVVMILGIVLAFMIVRSITKPIAHLVEGLSESADQVGSASTQISSTSQQLAEGASEQAAAIEETSSSLEEMSSMTKQNANNANQANQLMIGTRESVSRAGESMGHLTASMGEISRASEETSKIIKTIDEIAFQTNLLALNAAVEAARAGEAGAGFAVVADEVRNLALRAAEAAKNTANLIEDTVKRVKDGSELVGKTEQEFHEVATSVGRSGELVGEITAASVEQAQGIEQINKAVSEMDKVVQQNASNAEESASASEEINAQAQNLKQFIGELRSLVDGSSAHGAAGNRRMPGMRSSTGKIANASMKSHGATIFKMKPKSRKGNGGTAPKPEAVIPFGDEEGFSDF